MLTTVVCDWPLGGRMGRLSAVNSLASAPLAPSAQRVAAHPSGGSTRRQLCVVMPVHNEAGCIEVVVREWCTALDELAIDYLLLLINDGSTDGTLPLLRQLASQLPRLTVHTRAQGGHGTAVLTGYNLAVQTAEWVLQVDSDGELHSGDFARFWHARAQCDLLIGERRGRVSPLYRRMMTGGARGLVRRMFGGALPDANVPFRLMRADRLTAALEWIPPRAFAPNVLLSGLAFRLRWRIAVLPISARPRAAGTSTLRPARLLRAALRAGRETVHVAWRTRGLNTGKQLSGTPPRTESKPGTLA